MTPIYGVRGASLALNACEAIIIILVLLWRLDKKGVCLSTFLFAFVSPSARGAPLNATLPERESPAASFYPPLTLLN